MVWGKCLFLDFYFSLYFIKGDGCLLCGGQPCWQWITVSIAINWHKKAAHLGERLLSSDQCSSLSGWLLAIFRGRRQGGGVGLHLLLFALHVLDVNFTNGKCLCFLRFFVFMCVFVVTLRVTGSTLAQAKSAVSTTPHRMQFPSATNI